MVSCDDISTFSFFSYDYKNICLNAILILLFFLSFHYSPEQNSVKWQTLFWISHFFWQLKKSSNQKHYNFVYNYTVCFFIVLKLVESKINSACHPSLSIHKTCSRKKKINYISGRRKTTRLPSKHLYVMSQLRDVDVINLSQSMSTMIGLLRKKFGFFR